MTGLAECEGETLGIICGILAEILGTSEVEPERGFREMGGDSLRAVKAAGRIAIEFGTPDETNQQLLEAMLDGAGASVLARLVDEPGLPATVASAPEHTVHRALSYPEERLWLARSYHRDNAAYNIVNAFRVTGQLDLYALDQAVYGLLDRNPALRTRYDNQVPRAYADPAGPCEFADIMHYQEILRWEDALTAATAAATEAFDLSEGRLLRIRTFPTTDGARLLLVVVHHIAADGWSMELIYQDLSDMYAGSPVRPVSRSYHEYAIWQRAAREPLAAAEAVASRLGSLPDRLELGRGRQRPPERSMAGSVLRGCLPAATAARLRALAVESGSSLHVVLLAALYLCLARRSRQWDLVVGTVASGRTQPGFHQTVGFFANTLPVRVAAGLDTTIASLLDRLNTEARWMLAHQDAPLEAVALGTRQSPDRAHGPLVDAVLVLQSDGVVLPQFTGCSVGMVPMHAAGAKFDLMLEVTPNSETGSLELSWEYAIDILDSDDVLGLDSAFCRTASALAERRDMDTVRSVTSLSDLEWHNIRSATGAPRAWRGMDACLLFDRLASTGPAMPAVLDGPIIISRAELRGMRERVARCLADRQVKPGDVVAIHLPRSAESVAALLAAWWIGAVPAFIDTHHPAGHRDALVQACRPAAVLTLDSAGWPAGMQVVTWAEAVSSAEHAGPATSRSPDDAAWLVATSGSTGTPKITVGTHRGLGNRCAWAWEAFPYTQSEVVALRTPLGFVDAIAEAVVPLLVGVPLAIVPDADVWDGRELASVLGRHRVTRLLSTPSMLRHLLDVVPDLSSAAPALRWCASSGESLDAELLGRLQAALPRCRLLNLYGSSEVAGDATYAEVTDLPAGLQVPIGRPIANAGVLVVDAHGELVPPGTVGELVVTGAPVGLGYLADGGPVLAGGFRPAPGGEPGYWTGDLGWLGPDGLLYFAGRRDRQVKIRGCRVELGQVEAALLTMTEVGQAAAWADRTPDGEERIWAAAVPMPATEFTERGLRAQLRARLPSYMVPARILTAAALPLGPTGKLDRAALARLTPSPDHDLHDRAPAISPVQHRLWLLWSAALGGELAGLDDDFFALGGDSLAANSMLAAVAREAGVMVDLGDFLAKPTIRALAGLVARPPGHTRQVSDLAE